MDARLLLQSLKIHIEAVQIIFLHIRHQAVNELFPGGGGGQELLRLDIITEIVQERPDLDPLIMGRLYIILVCQGAVISFVIR